MHTTSKLTDCELKSLYESNIRVNDIAKLAGMTRQGVWKRLRKMGIETLGRGTITVACAFCGREFERFRARASKTIDCYCNQECFFASRENPNYIPWRSGQRLARAIIAQHTRLTHENVVHHIDGNNRNNDLVNLMVFANQSDHMKYHHGKCKILPLWSGKEA